MENPRKTPQAASKEAACGLRSMWERLDADRLVGGDLDGGKPTESNLAGREVRDRMDHDVNSP
jgi:hypothetical protein